jgi:hypothetical protein
MSADDARPCPPRQTDGFAVAYDLRDAGARGQARRHRDCWGRLYTDIHILDSYHIALVFRPAPDERWRAWERVRLEWLQEQAA